MKFHSAYLKLTLFYLLIVMTISLIFSSVIYKISSAEIQEGLAKQVRVMRGMPASGLMPFLETLES